MRHKIFYNNYLIFNRLQRYYSNNVLKPPWNVLFFGTDKFSLESLKSLHSERQSSNVLIDNLEVVTTQKNNDIRNYAQKHSIGIQNWPLTMPQPNFRFHIGIVVSFGHLIPKQVIEMFPMGIINVHASLLPRWRGAAPIIHALAAGDTITGVTVMRIQAHKFDVGEIVHQESVTIGKYVCMPELHETLAKMGARNLIHVLQKCPNILHEALTQNGNDVTYAPKISATMAHIDFAKQGSRQIFNLSRALHGLYPLITSLNNLQVKIHNVTDFNEEIVDSEQIGKVTYDKVNKSLKILTKDGFILVDKISVPGKRIMNATEFNNGYLRNRKTLKESYFCAVIAT